MSDTEPTANTSAEVVLQWGDGRYLFSLKGRQIEHLQKVCGTGIGQIAGRLFSQMPRYEDIRETIHQGLIGGGMSPVLATQKMESFFDGQPLDKKGDPSSPLKTAIAIMGAAWFGMDEVKAGGETAPGEAGAGETPAQ